MTAPIVLGADRPPLLQPILRVRLPIRTVSQDRSSNHFWAIAKRRKEQRGGTSMVLTGYLRQARFTVRWGTVVTLSRISAGMLDDDNIRAAMKSVRDGVADALGINDRDPRVEWRYAQLRGKPKEYAVQIEIGVMPRGDA